MLMSAYVMPKGDMRERARERARERGEGRGEVGGGWDTIASISTPVLSELWASQHFAHHRSVNYIHIDCRHQWLSLFRTFIFDQFFVFIFTEHWLNIFNIYISDLPWAMARLVDILTIRSRLELKRIRMPNYIFSEENFQNTRHFLVYVVFKILIVKAKCSTF